MTDADISRLTLSTAAAGIRRKEIDPVELTQAVLNRAMRLNERMRAFITIMEDAANTSLRSAERQPLCGVPLSLKDLYDTQGTPTTGGAKIFADRVPAEDATVVRRLREAGGVIIGKTNLHEFAFGVTTINPHYGTARNPWDPDRISGGSSGGSASAVAMSMGFGSLGSDTGGSIRIPSSLCGVAGLKPTYGRCSLSGVIPLSWSMDHPGPMGRCVEDVAILLGVIAGHDPRDPYSRRMPVPRYTEALTGDIRGVRIGMPGSYFFDRVKPEVDSAVRAAIHTLERLGADIVDVDLATAPLQRGVWGHIASAEAYSFHERHLETRADQYGADIRGRIEAGRLLLSVDYVRAQRARLQMQEECRRVFSTVDVIVTPTLPIAAPRIDETAVSWGSDSEPVGMALTRFTRHFNVVGLPAISIPCGFTKSGLPVGLQLAGRAFDEATVLRVAHAYEQDARWFERRPEL